MEFSNNSESMEQFKKEVETDLEDALEHGMIVGALARRLAKELNMCEEFCYDVALAGLLHDIGKMKLSRYLYWRTDDAFKIEEMKYVRLHPTYSYDILKNKDYSENVLNAIYFHHENYDGSGYPKKLMGHEIPESARVLRVCDVYAALTSDRPYRAAFDTKMAMELMIEEVKNFDMKIFLAFQSMINSTDVQGLVYENFFAEHREFDTYIQKCIDNQEKMKEGLQ